MDLLLYNKILFNSLIDSFKSTKHYFIETNDTEEYETLTKYEIIYRRGI